MKAALEYPLSVLILSLAALYLSERIGAFLGAIRVNINEEERKNLGLILSATLTLMSLIIGFTFSMAISRYDQRKNLEVAEANAIGTEYTRAGLLPDQDAALVRKILVSYLDQRILFYETRDDPKLLMIDATTDRLEASMWSAVKVPAGNQPTPVISLAVAGMNDVLNSRTDTEGAWLNRIPSEAWGLMAVVAISAHLLIGFDTRRTEASRALLIVLPMAVSISFFLIADIDSPRRGIIHIHPENLDSLSRSFHENDRHQNTMSTMRPDIALVAFERSPELALRNKRESLIICILSPETRIHL